MRRRALKKRYGRASSKSLKVVSRGAMGGIQWSWPGANGMLLMWNGPGSRLKLVMPSGGVTVIDHHTANGNYYTAAAARAAAKRFLAPDDDGEAKVCARCGKGASGCKCVGAGGTSGPFHSRSH